jgi:hypothetical protein
MKLFVFYIGGSMKNAHIELHDIRFCIGETLEGCFGRLRAEWWGEPDSLHLDCWGELTHADGYDISFVKSASGDASPGADRLYFVNLGGYAPEEFTELHKNVFVVAPTESKAKVRALKTVLDWKGHHKDYSYDVERTVCLDGVAASGGYRIVLTPAAEKPFRFEQGYRPIGASKTRV